MLEANKKWFTIIICLFMMIGAFIYVWYHRPQIHDYTKAKLVIKNHQDIKVRGNEYGKESIHPIKRHLQNA